MSSKNVSLLLNAAANSAPLEMGAGGRGVGRKKGWAPMGWLGFVGCFCETACANDTIFGLCWACILPI